MNAEIPRATSGPRNAREAAEFAAYRAAGSELPDPRRKEIRFDNLPPEDPDLLSARPVPRTRTVPRGFALRPVSLAVPGLVPGGPVRAFVVDRSGCVILRTSAAAEAQRIEPHLDGPTEAALAELGVRCGKAAL